MGRKKGKIYLFFFPPQSPSKPFSGLLHLIEQLISQLQLISTGLQKCKTAKHWERQEKDFKAVIFLWINRVLKMDRFSPIQLWTTFSLSQKISKLSIPAQSFPEAHVCDQVAREGCHSGSDWPLSRPNQQDSAQC